MSFSDPSTPHSHSVLVSARQTIKIEMEGMRALMNAVDTAYVDVVETLENCTGRIICIGVGKSGHIARKIAATLASTGTPAYYVHPAEASHGDLGMITSQDVVLALSKSGETKELADIIGHCHRFEVPLIAMTCKKSSTLAHNSTHILHIPDVPEACAETSAPTTSTTLMMVTGDALAVSLIERRGFSAQDFKKFHPGGALGAALASIEDVMRPLNALPLVTGDTKMDEAIIVMSAKALGCVGVISPDGRLLGIITDGDLRRHMAQTFMELRADQVMTHNPTTIGKDRLASEGLARMTGTDTKITQIFVSDEENRPVGLVHIHDLLRAGIA